MTHAQNRTLCPQERAGAVAAAARRWAGEVAAMSREDWAAYGRSWWTFLKKEAHHYWMGTKARAIDDIHEIVNK